MNNKFSYLKEKIKDFLEEKSGKKGNYTLVDGFFKHQIYNEEEKLVELPLVCLVNESTGETHFFSIGIIFPDWKEWWDK